MLRSEAEQSLRGLETARYCLPRTPCLVSWNVNYRKKTIGNLDIGLCPKVTVNFAGSWPQSDRECGPKVTVDKSMIRKVVL